MDDRMRRGEAGARVVTGGAELQAVAAGWKAAASTFESIMQRAVVGIRVVMTLSLLPV